MLNLILVGIAAAVLSGLVAFLTGRWFWATTYSKTNKAGDGGGHLLVVEFRDENAARRGELGVKAIG